MSNSNTTPRHFPVVFATLALFLAACGSGEGSTTSIDEPSDTTNVSDGLTVVASTTMLGDVVSNVVGDQATVEVLMPVGADPHDFQASSRQVSTMSTADLVVANGLGLEEGLHDVLEGAESDGARVLEVGALLAPIPFGQYEAGEPSVDAVSCDPELGHEHDESSETTEGEGEEHGHESCDPHVWMDPVRMAEAARLIGAELEEIAPGGGWVDSAEAYASALLAVNNEIVDILSAVPEQGRVLVTNHEAFGYFAELYDFEVVGVVIPGGSTLGEPSSSELADLIDVINQEQVPAIFTDLSSPSGLAETVAEEADAAVEVVGLYSESLGEPGSGADTLIGMLTTNAQRIANALS